MTSLEEWLKNRYKTVPNTSKIRKERMAILFLDML
ncbi:MAG: hypothetical protein ACI87M_000287 [Yoonia sp.]